MNSTLTMTFRAIGGNVVSTMRTIGGGLGQMGGQLEQNAAMSERFNNQWKAIGTTIRYALAGTAIFGLTRMVSQLAAVNQQLGQMQALSEIGPGVRYSTQDLTQLYQGLQQTAMDTIQPLTAVNDAAINFLSTVQGVQPGQLPTMLTQIGQGAQLAQTPIEDLTQAATTMQIAFGRAVNPTTIGQFERMWVRLIGIAPGGVAAAPTIAQAMPSLASMFQLAPGRSVAPNVRQAQMLGLTQSVLQTGMPPATAMRGLTYLLQSIAQPTGKAGEALAGIGITPDFVSKQGIFAALMRLLHHVSPVSSGRARQLGVYDLPDVASNDPSAALPGIPASQLTALRTMIPRIHGIRAAIILASQLQQRGNVSSVTQDIQHMINVQNENSDEAHQVAKAWDDLRRRSRLKEAANAINTMGYQIAQTFEPVLGFVATHVADPIARAAHRHPQLTHDAVIGGAAFLGLMGLNRFTGGMIGRGLGRIPIAGRLLGGALNMGAGNAFVREQAIQAAARGASGLGASPQNPVYVTVVGTLFAQGPGTDPTSGGGGTSPVGWFRGAGRFAASHPRLTMAGSAATIAGIALAQKGDQGPTYATHMVGRGIAFNPTSGRPYGYRNYIYAGNQHEHDIYTLTRAQERHAILRQAQRLLGGNVTGVSNYGVGMWHGQADVNMTITREHADGSKTRQRVHIPIGLFAGGRHPGNRGKPGKNVRVK